MMSSPSSTAKGSSPTCSRATRDRVAESERVLLADVVDVAEVRRLLDLLQQVVAALLLQVVLELEVAVEMVLDRPLAPPGDDEDVGEPGPDRLLHHVLDRRLVDDREHLLGLALGHRQEPGAESRRRDHCLADRGRHRTALLTRRVTPRSANARLVAYPGFSAGGRPELTGSHAASGSAPARAVLAALEEPPDIRRVPDDHDDRQRRDHPDLDRAVPTDRDEDREQDRAEQRADRCQLEHPGHHEPEDREDQRRSPGRAPTACRRPWRPPCPP